MVTVNLELNKSTLSKDRWESEKLYQLLETLTYALKSSQYFFQNKNVNF